MCENFFNWESYFHKVKKIKLNFTNIFLIKPVLFYMSYHNQRWASAPGEEETDYYRLQNLPRKVMLVEKLFLLLHNERNLNLSNSKHFKSKTDSDAAVLKMEKELEK